jgi:sugar lactone lactonase YvrE
MSFRTSSTPRLRVHDADLDSVGIGPAPVLEQPRLSLLAGSVGGSGNLDGPAGVARLFNPAAVVSDRRGNRYVSDRGNHMIRMIAPDGSVSTLAGRRGQRGWADGHGTEVLFNRPGGLALDGRGGLFVADSGNHVIRRIVVDTVAGHVGSVQTVAGVPGVSGHDDHRDPVRATFKMPLALAHADGQLFIADTGNHAIRRLWVGERVETLAGRLGRAGNAVRSATASDARFDRPSGLALDAAGDLFVIDAGNCVILRIAGATALRGETVVTLVAGANKVCQTIDGTVGRSRLATHCVVDNVPLGITVDGRGSLWFGQPQGELRRIDFDGVHAGQVVTVSRVGGPQKHPDEADDLSQFGYLAGLSTEDEGARILVADFFNDVIHCVARADAQVSTLAGQAPAAAGATDSSSGVEARFNLPGGLWLRPQGDVLVADQSGVRHLTAHGAVTTLRQLPPDSGGAIAVGEGRNGLLYVVTGRGELHAELPGGLFGFRIVEGGQAIDGAAKAARFVYLRGLDVDAEGCAIVADAGAHAIRRVTKRGDVSRLAGRYGEPGWAGGDALDDARFTSPIDVAVDAEGAIFVLDSTHRGVSRIHRVGNRDVVTLVAEGFDEPRAIAVDGEGNLYVAEGTLNVIVRVRPDGERSVIAGCPGVRGFAPGSLPGVLSGTGVFGLKARAGRLLMPMESGVVQIVSLG